MHLLCLPSLAQCILCQVPAHTSISTNAEFFGADVEDEKSTSEEANNESEVMKLFLWQRFFGPNMSTQDSEVLRGQEVII